MTKVTLDMSTFKALASDTRLDILRSLDGKKMSLKDISKATSLNKATLHEHLSKLHEAGLVKKKGREGHKWVYYKLSWKGECLLHPENTRIVVLFSATFFSLFFGIIQLLNFARGKTVGVASTLIGSDTTQVYAAEEKGISLLPETISFDYVADVPVQNQTIVKLSQALNDNATIGGVWNEARTTSDIQWRIKDLVGKGEGHWYGSGEAEALDSGVPPGSSFGISPPVLEAFVQDPMLLYIAVGCLILFMVLLFIGIWRLWENKIPKL